MHCQALATDYDGTLATNGRVTSEVMKALNRVTASGRKLILITGRELGDLLHVFPEARQFDRIVAENGAVLHCPKAREPKHRQTVLLGEPCPTILLTTLRERKIPISAGRVIVATTEPYKEEVVELIQRFDLKLDVILNTGAVMVLPRGVNKESGLIAALADLRISREEVIGVGDAENDQIFLRYCACSVAVANALPAIKEQADYVMEDAEGAGVLELIDRLILSEPQIHSSHALGR